jgi:hypothetical protein
MIFVMSHWTRVLLRNYQSFEVLKENRIKNIPRPTKNTILWLVHIFCPYPVLLALLTFIDEG